MAEYKFNLLIDELPSAVVVDGSSFLVNTDFRYGLLFNQLLNDDDISSEEKVAQALVIGYIEQIPEDLHKAFKALIAFYSCFDLDGRSIDELDDEQNEEKKNEEDEMIDDEFGNTIFDYEKDSLLIYSTFFEIYHIDLTEVNMHWYKFIALLRSLFDENNLTKVLQFRAMKIDGKMSPDMKRHYYRLKQHYSLNRKTEAELKEYKRQMMEEWG